MNGVKKREGDVKKGAYFFVMFWGAFEICYTTSTMIEGV